MEQSGVTAWSPAWGPTYVDSRGWAPRCESVPRSALFRLTGMRTSLLIICIYILVIRIGGLSASKIGLQAGPVPMFLTDFTLLALLMVSLPRSGGRMLWWSTSGKSAGAIGSAVWLLLVVSVAYFAAAFHAYGVSALRDFAIFSYSVFFPLTYFAIGGRPDAGKLLRCFAYSGALVAALILLQAATGIQVGFGLGQRYVFGENISRFASGDEAAVMATSFGALLGYAVFQQRYRKLHIFLVAICLVAIALSTVRSGLVGAALAVALTLVIGRAHHRLAIVGIAAALVAVVVLGATIPPFELPGLLRSFYLSLGSAARGAADPTAGFRIMRWEYALKLWYSHPLFGVGYGAQLLPYSVDPQQFQPGRFNGVMPHNTFLFLLARMGLPGISLVCFCWISGLWSAARTAAQNRLADNLAAANALAAMAGYGALNLFFERPSHNVPFWIMLAVAVRLVETSIRASVPVPSHTGIPQPRVVMAGAQAANTAVG